MQAATRSPENKKQYVSRFMAKDAAPAGLGVIAFTKKLAQTLDSISSNTTDKRIIIKETPPLIKDFISKYIALCNKSKSCVRGAEPKDFSLSNVSPEKKYTYIESIMVDLSISQEMIPKHRLLDICILLDIIKDLDADNGNITFESPTAAPSSITSQTHSTNDGSISSSTQSYYDSDASTYTSDSNSEADNEDLFDGFGASLTSDSENEAPRPPKGPASRVRARKPTKPSISPCKSSTSATQSSASDASAYTSDNDEIEEWYS